MKKSTVLVCLVACCIVITGTFVLVYSFEKDLFEVGRRHALHKESQGVSIESAGIRWTPFSVSEKDLGIGFYSALAELPSTGNGTGNATDENKTGYRPSQISKVIDRRKFNLTAKLNLWQHSETGYLGNQMFIFHSTVAIANVHGMRPIFAKKQLQMLNDVFDLVEYTVPRFQISVLDEDREPNYPVRNADAWAPGKIYIDPLHNTKIGTYIQNINHFNYILDELGAPVNPRTFYRFRQKYVEAAEKMLPGFPHCIGLHVRFFPPGHLEGGHNTCPTGPVVQRQVDKIATKDKCLFVFSNDIARAKSMVSAPCVHYVNPGETHFRSGFTEIHPIGGLHEVARDFVALTRCNELVVTCGTFSALAAMMHSGITTYWWPFDAGLRSWKDSALTKSWVPYE
jgi:hypothetical protein